MDRRRLMLVVAAVIAALGVALVFVFARGAESRAAEKYQTTEVVTVSPGQTILPGETVESALTKLSLTKVPKGQVLDGALRKPELAALNDKVALTALYAGEQLIPSKFGGVGDTVNVATLPLPKGLVGKQEAFDLPIGSFILPGSQLAVFLTVDASTPTCLLIDRVSVIAVGVSTQPPVNGEEAPAVGASPVLTLAVDQQQFEQIEDGKKRGVLSVALLNSESEVKSDKSGPCAAIRNAR